MNFPEFLALFVSLCINGAFIVTFLHFDQERTSLLRRLHYLEERLETYEGREELAL